MAELKAYIGKTSRQQDDTFIGISKDDLVAMKDRINQTAQDSTAGINKLISGFGQADVNGDGKIDFEELQEFLKTGETQESTDQKKATSTAETTGASAPSEQASSTSEESQQFSPKFLQRLVQHYGQRIQAQSGSRIQLQA